MKIPKKGIIKCIDFNRKIKGPHKSKKLQEKKNRRNDNDDNNNIIQNYDEKNQKNAKNHEKKIKLKTKGTKKNFHLNDDKSKQKGSILRMSTREENFNVVQINNHNSPKNSGQKIMNEKPTSIVDDDRRLDNYFNAIEKNLRFNPINSYYNQEKIQKLLFKINKREYRRTKESIYC